MTRKEQNKILDDKTESNINQYKVDRLNAEISTFSSGDLNKYEFLTRKDLKYKPNALAKARFEFSPLGKAFSTGLDKTAQGYQEEGVMKLLKDIRDSLRGDVITSNNSPNNDNGGDNDDDDNDDNDDDNDGDMLDLETEEEAAERIAKNESKISDDDKVFDVLNKFNDKMEIDMCNLDKMVTDKENKWSTKLNKLNNDVKKLDNYIKENNNKKINAEIKLDIVNNERNKLLLKYNQSNEELNRTKNELYETKNKLTKAENDINEKTKYIDELKEIQEKFDYQNNKVTELESELNKKNKNIDTLKNNIKDLENENREIFIKSNRNFEIINKKHDQEIEKLEKKPKKK